MSTLRAYVVLIGAVSLVSSAMAHGTGNVLNVNCAKGRSIQQALDEARPADTIRVKGRCSEDVTVVKDGITLKG